MESEVVLKVAPQRDVSVTPYIQSECSTQLHGKEEKAYLAFCHERVCWKNIGYSRNSRAVGLPSDSGESSDAVG
jgi:hypothetical protein